MGKSVSRKLCRQTSQTRNAPVPSTCLLEPQLRPVLLQLPWVRQWKNKKRFLQHPCNIPATVEMSFGFTQLNVSVLAQTFFLSYVIVKDTVLFMWRPKAFFPHSEVPKKWWIRTLGWFICFSHSLTVFSISSTHCHSGKSCRYQQQPWLTPWLSQLLGTIFTVMQILAYCLATSGYLGLVPWLWRGKMFDIIWVNLTVVALFVVIINTSV